MSDLLNRLNHHIIVRSAGTLLVEARDELRRLEKENAALNSYLIEIRNLSQRTGYSFEGKSLAATRLATEALMA